MMASVGQYRHLYDASAPRSFTFRLSNVKTSVALSMSALGVCPQLRIVLCLTCASSDLRRSTSTVCVVMMKMWLRITSASISNLTAFLQTLYAFQCLVCVNAVMSRPHCGPCNAALRARSTASRSTWSICGYAEIESSLLACAQARPVRYVSLINVPASSRICRRWSLLQMIHMTCFGRSLSSRVSSSTASSRDAQRRALCSELPVSTIVHNFLHVSDNKTPRTGLMCSSNSA